MAGPRPDPSSCTVLDAIAHSAERWPDQTAFEFAKGDGTVARQTFAELADAVQAMGARLTQVAPPGARAVVLYPPGLDYIVAVCGAMAARIAAVPAYPPTSPQHLPRLRSLLASCGADLVLASKHFIELEGQLAGTSPDQSSSVAPWILGTSGHPVPGRPSAALPDDVALIQYTSGSTSAPRGVVLTHRSIISNLAMIESAMGLTSDDRVVLWLPPYHDMGLIGGILAPLWAGCGSRLISPLQFLRDPLSWLSQISELRGTIAGGPNFGFDRCVRRLSRDGPRSLDLRCWRVAFTGAEPVHAASLARFAAAFAPYGFCEEAFYPCYGLAEVTLMATGGRRGGGAAIRAFSRRGLQEGEAREPVGPRDRQELVGNGRAVPGLMLRIVDESGRSLPAGSVGEIRLSGPNVAAGYVGHTRGPEATAFVDHEGRREVATRDIGFVDDDGELFICGRASEMIILRGRNVHPEDVELVVEEALPQPGLAIAFGLDVDGDEQLIVLREARGLVSDEVAWATARIRSRLGEVLGLQPAVVLLVRRGALPRTSSGKVQRGEARRRYLLQQFDQPAPPPVAVAATPTDDPVLALCHSVARVLDLPPVAVVVTQSATRLGLDSIGAVAVAEDVEERHGLVISPAELVGDASLEELARAAARAPRQPDIAGDDDPIEASDGERAMWLHERLGEGPSPYVLPVAFELETGVDPAALEQALADVVSRSPALRTTWSVDDGVLRRRVAPKVELDLRVERLGALGADELRDALDAASRCRLDPETLGGTHRATLFEIGPARRVLHLAVHHLVADHSALLLLVADLARCYEARLAGVAPPPSTTTGTADAVRRESDLLSSDEGVRMLASWVDRLRGAPPPPRLPASRSRGEPLRFDAGTVPIAVSPRTDAMVRDLARSEGTTPFVVLAAAVHALLARLTGQADVVIGAPTSRRVSRSRRGALGLLMNVMPLRVVVVGSASFRQLVRKEHAVVTAARAGEDIPFVRIVEAIGLRGESSPLYTTTLTMLDRPTGRNIPGTCWQVIEIPQPGVAVDLAFDVRVGQDTMAIDLRWARQVLADRDADRVAFRFSRLLDHAVAVPDRAVSAMALSDAAERELLLALGTPATSTPAPKDVFARFAEHADRTPDAVAVRTPTESVTYAALYRQACTLAAELREIGEHVVAVRLPRGSSLVTAMLAALAAEVAWVPVDPDTPIPRVARMLAEVDAHVLIAEDGLPDAGRPLRVVSPRAASRGQLYPPPANGRGLAYVMFTSGSSGRPKGVMIERRSLSALLDAVARLEPVASRRRVLALTNVGFDISVLEMLLPLAVGASVVVTGPDGMRAPDALFELIASQGVDLVQATPSALSVLLDEGLRLDGITVLCGGEAAPPGLFQRLREAGAEAAVNVYGPTETTIWSTAQIADDGSDPPLGRPLARESVYVLDEQLDLVPIDVEGELCIGGVGVARGYVGQPALTAERFVPDPFSAEPGARMYRTGDAARYDGEHELRFGGRGDGQVKIRGARVECAEVELALQEHAAIRRAAVVVADEAAGPVLLAAVQWQDGERASGGELRAFLADRLPPQAVPAIFRVVDEVPMTDRGKLDVRALTHATPLDDGPPGGAPATPTQDTLAQIWRSVLGIAMVGPADDFFALGGHSLLAVSVVTQVRERLGRRISVADVLQAPRLAQLACRVDQAEPVEGAVVRAAAAHKTLGDAQRRLWAFEQVHPGTATANISLAVRIEGTLDVDALREAANAVLRRHAELAAAFPSDAKGRPVRRLRADRSIDLEPVAVAAAGLSRLHREILRPFDIERGPLVRLTLLRTRPDEHLLALTVHHLVADAAAATILLRELSAFYHASISGSGEPPAAPVTGYADLVARLAAGHDPAREAGDLAWWRDTLAGAPRRLFPPASPGAGGGVEAGTVGDTTTNALREFAKAAGATPFIVVLAVLARVLAGRTGQDQIVIGTDVSGRDEPGADQVVGPLVNQVALRIDTTVAPRVADLIEHALTQLTGALAHSRVSYDRVVAAVAPGATERGLFDVKLAYQPAVEHQLQLGDLQVTVLPRAPTPPAEALVLFVRERAQELVVELQYRDDVVDRDWARDLLQAFLESVESLVTPHDVAEPPAPRPSGAVFTRRVARTLATPAPGRLGEPDSSDPSSPPVIRAVADADLASWIGEHKEEICDALTLHGALLFRGFHVFDADALHEVVQAAGEPPYVSTEHDRVTLGTHVYTPIPYSSRERLLWHNEDTFRPEWPARLWFACGRPADDGGETSIADSRAVLGALGEAGERLARDGIMYIRRFEDGLGQSWQRVLATSDRAKVEAQCRAQGIVAAWEGDRLVTRTVRPATCWHPSAAEPCWIGQLLHFHPAALSETARSSLVALYGEDGLPRDCRYADGSPIPHAVVHALVAAYEASERLCRWEPGDVLLFDNMLMAHGRRPYVGERTLYVAMTGRIQHRPAAVSAKPAVVRHTSPTEKWREMPG